MFVPLGDDLRMTPLSKTPHRWWKKGQLCWDGSKNNEL
jgi:hypothetical protein